MINEHNVNSEIILDSYRINLVDKKDSLLAEGNVKAIQQFQPKPILIFKGELTLRNIDRAYEIIFNYDNVYSKFVDFDEKVECIIININDSIGAKENFEINFVISEAYLILQKQNKINSLYFNLVNFNKELIDDEINFNNWILKLERINNNDDEYEELENTGGFLVTHKGNVSKKDNSIITSVEVDELLDFLYKLFSFCKGVTTIPFLVEGFDSEGNWTWTKIGNAKHSAWEECNNWFTNSGIYLNQFVEGFYRYTQEENYKEYFNEILHWYNLIHSSSDNYTSVILANTALDLISWIYLTKDSKVLSIDGFHKLPSGDRLALTLRYNGIPTNVPNNLKNLVNLGQEFSSAPLLFSTIRNKIVHPESKRRDDFTHGLTILETKLLGTWYLELFILAKSNYQDEYSNLLDFRGWKGDTKFVPWSIK